MIGKHEYLGIQGLLLLSMWGSYYGGDDLEGSNAGDWFDTG